MNEDHAGGGSSDDPDQFVFDEAFIRGGVHEPPARTRAAIARHGAREDASRAGNRAQRGPRGRGSRSRTVLLIATAIVVLTIGGFAVFNGIHGQGGTAASPAVAALPAGAGAATTRTATPTSETIVYGLDHSDAPGTCYNGPDSTGSVSHDMVHVSCSLAHRYELVSHRTAVGSSSAYPTQTYWSGPMLDACLTDMAAYMGQPHSQWPAGVNGKDFKPLSPSWVTGNRDVFCVAETVPSSTGSVKK